MARSYVVEELKLNPFYALFSESHRAAFSKVAIDPYSLELIQKCKIGEVQRYAVVGFIVGDRLELRFRPGFESSDSKEQLEKARAEFGDIVVSKGRRGMVHEETINQVIMREPDLAYKKTIGFSGTKTKDGKFIWLNRSTQNVSIFKPDPLALACFVLRDYEDNTYPFEYHLTRSIPKEFFESIILQTTKLLETNEIKSEDKPVTLELNKDAYSFELEEIWNSIRELDTLARREKIEDLIIQNLYIASGLQSDPSHNLIIKKIFTRAFNLAEKYKLNLNLQYIPKDKKEDMLVRAAQAESQDIVDLLLEHKADRTAYDNYLAAEKAADEAFLKYQIAEHAGSEEKIQKIVPKLIENKLRDKMDIFDACMKKPDDTDKIIRAFLELKNQHLEKRLDLRKKILEEPDSVLLIINAYREVEKRSFYGEADSLLKNKALNEFFEIKKYIEYIEALNKSDPSAINFLQYQNAEAVIKDIEFLYDTKIKETSRESILNIINHKLKSEKIIFTDLKKLSKKIQLLEQLDESLLESKEHNLHDIILNSSEHEALNIEKISSLALLGIPYENMFHFFDDRTAEIKQFSLILQNTESPLKDHADYLTVRLYLLQKFLEDPAENQLDNLKERLASIQSLLKTGINHPELCKIIIDEPNLLPIIHSMVVPHIGQPEEKKLIDTILEKDNKELKQLIKCYELLMEEKLPYHPNYNDPFNVEDMITIIKNLKKDNLYKPYMQHFIYLLRSESIVRMHINFLKEEKMDEKAELYADDINPLNINYRELLAKKIDAIKTGESLKEKIEGVDVSKIELDSPPTITGLEFASDIMKTENKYHLSHPGSPSLFSRARSLTEIKTLQLQREHASNPTELQREAMINFISAFCIFKNRDIVEQISQTQIDMILSRYKGDEDSYQILNKLISTPRH